MPSRHSGTQAREGAISEAVGRAGLGAADGADLAPRAAPAAPMQTALTFGADGSAVITAEPASVRKRHHRGIRDDARRAAEYVASRGTTPLEALHNVGRLDWRRAVSQIVKGTGCTKLEAFRLWVSINESLLPYTAARLNTLDLGDNAAGGLAMAHFLAASVMSERLARSDSPDRESVDRSQVIDISSEKSGLPGDVTHAGLPPKGTDSDAIPRLGGCRDG